MAKHISSSKIPFDFYVCYADQFSGGHLSRISGRRTTRAVSGDSCFFLTPNLLEKLWKNYGKPFGTKFTKNEPCSPGVFFHINLIGLMLNAQPVEVTFLRSYSRHVGGTGLWVSIVSLELYHLRRWSLWGWQVDTGWHRLTQVDHTGWPHSPFDNGRVADCWGQLLWVTWVIGWCLVDKPSEVNFGIQYTFQLELGQTWDLLGTISQDLYVPGSASS